MTATMDAVVINAVDYVDDARPVVESAQAIADRAVAALLAGGVVVVCVRGVRGVSSSFFNIILSAVAPVLKNDFSDGRFHVDTETKTQHLVLERSIAALTRR